MYNCPMAAEHFCMFFRVISRSFEGGLIVPEIQTT